VLHEPTTKAMSPEGWLFRRGELARDGWETVADASIPGWAHTGLRVGEVGAAEERLLEAGSVERIVVPLAGSFSVRYTPPEGDEVVQRLEGRPSVFAGPSDVLYLGVGTLAVVTGSGRFAVAEAPADERFPCAYVPRDRVAIELRGAGQSSRQVHNFGTPANLQAARFMVVEVITPSMNWSSFPPHKHDEEIEGRETALEEIYYFETAVTRAAGPRDGTDPVGFFRAYPSELGPIEIMEAVRTGDVALLPYGFHGPTVAAPGYDLYFLNVMAGPSHRRVWMVTEDPAHGWVKGTFGDGPVDPRLPYDRPDGDATGAAR
jgi:5-deoxy-glucuronate isomerase